MRCETRDDVRRKRGGGSRSAAVSLLYAGAVTLAMLSFVPRAGSAQIVDELRETVEEAAEDEALRHIEDFVRNAVKCVFDDLECIRSAEAGGEDVVLTDGDGEVMYDDEGRPVTDPEGLPPEERADAYEAFEFQPGERTLVEIDFEEDRPGDFPRRLAFLGGNMEVVETPGGRFVRAEDRAGLAVPLGETLPEQFTIEFEATDPQASSGVAVMLVRPEPARERYGAPEAAFFAAGRSHGSGIYGPDDRPLSVTDDRRLKDDTLPVRIMVHGEHAKMFIGTRRVANVPRVELGRSDSLYVFLHGYNERRPMIGDLRVAAGGRDLYEAIEAEGRVAVRDILFDTGRAEIRPASGEILADIAGMLDEHPGLSLMIEGHTDDRGEFEANMQLSSERAEAVKSWLVERHGVDPGRLRAMGLGPTRPVADNDTDAGRQMNRRVELVRIGGAN